MDERYAILGQAGVRNVQAFNALSPEEIYERIKPETDEEQEEIPTHMPYIVIVADEMADLMMVGGEGGGDAHRPAWRRRRGRRASI